MEIQVEGPPLWPVVQYVYGGMIVVQQEADLSTSKLTNIETGNIEI